ncbi:MAG: hypothetical protein ACI4U2_01805 [Christensenellaceae bacterium]
MNEKNKKLFSIILVAFFGLLLVLTTFSSFIIVQRYERYQKELTELEKSYITLQSEYSEKATEYEKQKDQLNQITEELVQAQQDLEEMRTQLARLESDIEMYKEYQQEYAKLLSSYNELQAKYDAVTQHPEVNYDMLWDIVESRLPGVICIGDSLTAGNTDCSYPLVLQSRIQNEIFYRIPVVTCAQPGKPSDWIVDYSGVTFTYHPEYMDYIFVVWIGTNGGWSVPVVDEYGNPVYDTDKPLYDDEGNPQTDEYGNPLYEQKTQEDPEVLVSQINWMLGSHTDPDDRFVVINITNRNNTNGAALDEALSAAFGKKFINLRQYLSTQAIYDAGITPTEADRNLMAIGRPPASLMQDMSTGAKDPTHFNDTGYTLIGNYIYEQLDSLGYFDTAKAKINQYLK